MRETDLTAKARRAAEWFNATQDKTRGTYETADLESDGWSVYTFYRYGKTAHDNSCRYDGMSDRMLIAFAEDRGWQDQEADGVEWELGSEFARVSGVITAWVHRDNDTWYWEVNDDARGRIRDSGGCHTREEARRQAVEAARGMG